MRDAESKKLRFEELGGPSHAEVLDVARRTAERIDALLRKSGRSLERQGDEPEPELLLDEPGLASCYAAAAQDAACAAAQQSPNFPRVRRICDSTGLGAAGVNTAEAMALTGHTDPRTHAGYVET